MKKLLLLFFTIGLLGFFGFWVQDIDLNSVSTKPKKGDDPAATSTAAHGGEGQANIVRPTVKYSESTKPRKNFLESEKSEIDALIDAAVEGDPDAAYMLYDITVRCNGLHTTESYTRIKETYFADKKTEYVEWMDHKFDLCSNLGLGEFSHPSTARELLDQSSHPWVMAKNIYKVAAEHGEEAAEVVAIQVFESRNAEAIAALLPYIAFGRTKYDVEFVLYDYQRDVTATAFIIFSCELGWSACYAESEYMWGSCGSIDRQCSASDNLVSMLMQNSWSPEVFSDGKKLAHIFMQHYTAGEYLEILRFQLAELE